MLRGSEGSPEKAVEHLPPSFLGHSHTNILKLYENTEDKLKGHPTPNISHIPDGPVASLWRDCRRGADAEHFCAAVVFLDAVASPAPIPHVLDHHHHSHCRQHCDHH